LNPISLTKELGMDATATAPFLRHFCDLKDPRRHNVRHVFTDILTIAILAVICTADDWDDVVVWAKARHDWLKTFLSLPRGIPSPDTFARVFARLDPDAFERCFIAWTSDLARAMGDGSGGGGGGGDDVVAIDGKTLRRSFGHAWERQTIHLVSAWAAEHQLVLGQLAVDDKSNEITAIPKLLDLLSLGGATVTIDAMGCQREIAGRIRGKRAHYVLAVKENQPTLHERVRKLLDEARLEMFAGMSHGYFEATNAGHGRIEMRKVWVSDEVKWLGEELLGQWPDLSSIAVVESIREVPAAGAAAAKRGESKVTATAKTTAKIKTTERRYFISSHAGVDAAAMARRVRGHWGVENRLHWQLDMTFDEDASRIHKDHGAQNFSRLRRLALNLLKRAPGKGSLKGKRFRCSLDQAYLLSVLSQ
jgi:predicted transposase YbfD/YdcC